MVRNSSELHGEARAPPVTNVVPDSTTLDKQHPQLKLNSRLTALERLKAKLGKDAHLLNYIPVSKVQMVLGDQMFSLSPHRILVGLGNLEDQSCKIWAFVSEKTRHDGSIDIKVYGEDIHGGMHKHSVDEMDQYGQWLDLYDMGIKARNVALIKCCFMMKGIELPQELDFTDGFVNTVKRVCRQCKDGNKSDHKSSDNPAKQGAPAPPAYEGPMTARKTQQRGPSGQLFSLHNPAASQEPSTSPVKDKTGVKGTGLISTSTKTAKLSLQYEEIIAGTCKTPPTEPVAMRKDNQDIRSSGTPSQARLLPENNVVRSVSPVKNATTASKTTRTHDTPLAASSEVQASFDNLFTRSAALGAAVFHVNPIAAMTPPPEEHTSPPRILTDGPAHYQALKSQMNDIEDELEGIDTAAQDNKKKYDRLRKERKYSIDIVMRERHKAEIKAVMEELERKHKAEESAEKGEYRALVAEYDTHQNAINKQRESVLERKKAADHDLTRRKDSLSREELLEYLDRCANTERAQKRRKTWYAGAEENKE